MLENTLQYGDNLDLLRVRFTIVIQGSDAVDQEDQ